MKERPIEQIEEELMKAIEDWSYKATISTEGITDGAMLRQVLEEAEAAKEKVDKLWEEWEQEMERKAGGRK